MNVQFLGDVLGTITQSLRLPATPNPKFGIIPEQNGQLAPSPCYFRVSEFANVLRAGAEQRREDSHRLRRASCPSRSTASSRTDNDYDWFKFKAKKGQAFDINVFARRLRSPLDPVLVINKDGKDLAMNDDSGGPDSYLRVQRAGGWGIQPGRPGPAPPRLAGCGLPHRGDAGEGGAVVQPSRRSTRTATRRSGRRSSCPREIATPR